MVKEVINSPKGKTPINFMTDSRGIKYTDVIFRSRTKLGRLLKGKTIKRIKVPKGMRVLRIQNHTPKIQQVTITYIKRRKK